MTKPNYGFDAPTFIRDALLIGVATLITGWFIPSFTLAGFSIRFLGPLVMMAGAIPLLLGLSLIVYGLAGKFNIRDQMLGMINWHGHERVLDIGTGRGLLLVGAAQKLTTGKATGIDIWRAEDLTNNTIDQTQQNITLAGVTDRTELKTEDAQTLTFADGSFDVVLSLLCIHNIDAADGRTTACREIARVLAPGGIAIIGDYINTDEYAAVFREAGLLIDGPRSYITQAYSMIRIVTARKQRV